MSPKFVPFPVMKSFPFIRLAMVLVGLTFSAAVVRAEDLGAVKARIEQRISTVNALKQRGVAGENNRGFLEVRGNATGDDQRVIAEENSDRRTVYTALAQQTGASADHVGRQRAQQLASLATRGMWIQQPSGEWQQKN